METATRCVVRQCPGLRDFSVQPPCSLCLCGCSGRKITTETQRTQRLHREAVQIRSPFELGRSQHCVCSANAKHINKTGNVANLFPVVSASTVWTALGSGQYRERQRPGQTI